MSNTYTIEYLHENNYRKKERAVKKYNMLAYKKLLFEYYPDLRAGKFSGVIIFDNREEKITKYELKLPTDTMFSRIYGDIILHYTVYHKQKIVMLDTITPDDILTDGHQNELSTYKGIPISKSHAEKDMFKINLLNMLEGGSYSSYNNYSSNRNNNSSFKRDVNKKNSSIKEKKATKKADEKIVENLVKDKAIDKYLSEWCDSISYYNRQDDYNKATKDIINNIENLLNNSFKNMDYYKDKFYEFIMVYLNKGNKSFMEIRDEFLNYLLKRNKDEVLEFNINLLRNNINFDLSLKSWINDWVINKRLIMYVSTNNENEKLYLYGLNKDKLTENQAKALEKGSFNYWLCFFLIILIVLLPFIIMSNDDSKIESYVINDKLNSFEGNIHTEHNINVLKDILEDNKNDVNNLIELIYNCRGFVFVVQNTYRDGNYYLEMSDSFYDEFVKKIDNNYHSNEDGNYVIGDTVSTIRSVKINSKDKVITFYDKNYDIEFNLYTNSGYKYGYIVGNIVTLD